MADQVQHLIDRIRKDAVDTAAAEAARVRQQAEQSRDYIVSKAGWPKTVFGGYLPGH